MAAASGSNIHTVGYILCCAKRCGLIIGEQEACVIEGLCSALCQPKILSHILGYITIGKDSL